MSDVSNTIKRLYSCRLLQHFLLHIRSCILSSNVDALKLLFHCAYCHENALFKATQALAVGIKDFIQCSIIAVMSAEKSGNVISR